MTFFFQLIAGLKLPRLMGAATLHREHKVVRVRPDVLGQIPSKVRSQGLRREAGSLEQSALLARWPTMACKISF